MHDFVHLAVSILIVTFGVLIKQIKLSASHMLTAFYLLNNLPFHWRRERI
jgi:hypothetical protein